MAVVAGGMKEGMEMVSSPMLISAAMLLIAGLGVVAAPKALQSALFLVLALFLSAVHFALLDAHFLAVVQVMVYAGAIMVLVIFVILLLGLKEEMESPAYRPPLAAGLVAGVFFLLALFGSLPSASGADMVSLERLEGRVEALGRLLFTEYLYPFELVSVLLLAAIVGAVMLADEPRRFLPRGRGLRAASERGERLTGGTK